MSIKNRFLMALESHLALLKLEVAQWCLDDCFEIDICYGEPEDDEQPERPQVN